MFDLGLCFRDNIFLGKEITADFVNWFFCCWLVFRAFYTHLIDDRRGFLQGELLRQFDHRQGKLVFSPPIFCCRHSLIKRVEPLVENEGIPSCVLSLNFLATRLLPSFFHIFATGKHHSYSTWVYAEQRAFASHGTVGSKVSKSLAAAMWDVDALCSVKTA